MSDQQFITTGGMSPLDALNILNQAAALAPLNRQGHVQAQAAVQVIAALLQRMADEPPESAPEE